MRNKPTMASSSRQVVMAEVYARHYTKDLHEDAQEGSAARLEAKCVKEAMEREAMIQRGTGRKKDRIAREREAAEQRKLVQRAWLQEEEKAQAELLRRLSAVNGGRGT